ncbi:MAG TPA: hypothetical protein VGM39_06475 [Kofleriaceae bacterium]|jgi:hypothetical protein
MSKSKTARPAPDAAKTEHLKTLDKQRARAAAKLKKRRRIKSGQASKR